MPDDTIKCPQKECTFVGTFQKFLEHNEKKHKGVKEWICRRCLKKFDFLSNFLCHFSGRRCIRPDGGSSSEEEEDPPPPKLSPVKPLGNVPAKPKKVASNATPKTAPAHKEKTPVQRDISTASGATREKTVPSAKEKPNSSKKVLKKKKRAKSLSVESTDSEFSSKDESFVPPSGRYSDRIRNPKVNKRKGSPPVDEIRKNDDSAAKKLRSNTVTSASAPYINPSINKQHAVYICCMKTSAGTCSFKADYKSNFKRHISKYNFNVDFPCGYCGKHIRGRASFLQHMEDHVSKNDNPLEAEYGTSNIKPSERKPLSEVTPVTDSLTDSNKQVKRLSDVSVKNVEQKADNSLIGTKHSSNKDDSSVRVKTRHSTGTKTGAPDSELNQKGTKHSTNKDDSSVRVKTRHSTGTKTGAPDSELNQKGTKHSTNKDDSSVRVKTRHSTGTKTGIPDSELNQKNLKNVSEENVSVQIKSEVLDDHCNTEKADAEATGPEIIGCPHCDAVLYDRMSMSEHLNYSHLKSYKKLCPLCDKALLSLKDMLQHIPVCKPSFTLTKFLEQLINKWQEKSSYQRIVPESSNHMQCPICTFVSGSITTMKQHFFKEFMYTGGDKNKEFEIYFWSFLRKERQRFLSQTQNTALSYTCNVCFKGFRQVSDFRVHLYQHHNHYPFVCSCGSGFYTLPVANKHMSRVHKPGKGKCKFELDEFIERWIDKMFEMRICQILSRLSCVPDQNKCVWTECNFSGSDFLEVQEHIKTVHVAKKLSCSECSFSTFSACWMRKHEQEHKVPDYSQLYLIKPYQGLRIKVPVEQLLCSFDFSPDVSMSSWQLAELFS